MQKKIRDCIHGFIYFSESERQIIDSRYFQRLKRIRQLAFTDMVYPCSGHSRFEHSLGVMEMATRMFDCLLKKDKITFLNALGITNDSKTNLEQEQETAKKLERYRKIVRFAALLHDIGHAPFSHAGESLLPSPYKHEDYSVEIIKTHYKDKIESSKDIKVEEVLALIKDNANTNSGLILLKTLISGQVDADRADYLLRDSYHLGVHYGTYDKEIFLESLNIGYKVLDSGRKQYEIGLDKKAFFVAENIIYARYQMFTQVYYHKVRRIYDYHIENAVKTILCNNYSDSGGKYPSPKEIDEYLKFDDWRMLGHISNGDAGVHGEIILNREHFDCVYSSGFHSGKNEQDELEDKKQELKKIKMPIWEDRNDFIKFYKVEGDIALIEKTTDTPKITYLFDESAIVKTMMVNPCLHRLYKHESHLRKFKKGKK